MMKDENLKSLLIGVLLFTILFGGSYFWRENRDQSILENSKFTIAKITKKTGSLTSGEQWHYEFRFNKVLYNSYRSTHVDYDVHLGDYFLVNFSSKKPTYNKILYQYKLKSRNLSYLNTVWDTIPISIVYSGLKK